MFPLMVRNRPGRLADPLDTISREFDRVLSRYMGESEMPAALAPYAVDVHEDADHFYVEAELPGFKKEEVEITLESGILMIHAERKEEEKSKKGEPLHVERRWSEFQRSFTLPTAVKEDSVRAELKDGLLEITMDKREEVKPRKIQITAGNVAGGAKLEAKNEPKR